MSQRRTSNDTCLVYHLLTVNSNTNQIRANYNQETPKKCTRCSVQASPTICGFGLKSNLGGWSHFGKGEDRYSYELQGSPAGCVKG